MKMEGPVYQEPVDDYSMFESRNREQEILSVIDGASAILSQKGGHVLSVRSSLL
jgi:hypothetical protein